MFAIIKKNGKQFKVTKNHIIKLEKINKKIGEDIKLTKILIIKKNTNILIGLPYIKNIMIIATIIEQSKEKKINILKFIRRKHHIKHRGHRQNFTKIKIKNFILKG